MAEVEKPSAADELTDNWVISFLVRLKKIQVAESLDRLAADGRHHISLLVPGVSPKQIRFTKNWVLNEVLSVLTEAVKADEEDDRVVPPTEKAEGETEPGRQGAASGAADAPAGSATEEREG